MTENAPSLSTDIIDNPYAAPTSLLIQEPMVTQYELAPRGIRLAAALVDWLLMLLICGAIVYFISGDFSSLLARVKASGIPLGLIGMLMIASIYLVINGNLLAQNGQTIGKFLFSIRIVRVDGTEAGLLHIVVRRYFPILLLQSIPVVGPFLSLADALCIFRSSHQCLHDQIADTVVIEATKGM